MRATGLQKIRSAQLIACICLALSAILLLACAGKPHNEQQTVRSSPHNNGAHVVVLSETQAKAVKVETVTTHEFVDQREAVGYVDFNHERITPVFSPWEGRISQVLVKVGEDVKKDQPLFIIDSPDLVEAESALISTAAALELSSRTLERLKKLVEIQGAPQKELEQAISDHQTAQASHEAAYRTVRIFGKSEKEINQIVSSRKTDGKLVIVSPFSGRVTSRNAAPGMLVQPGEAPAPVTVANISKMWMIANAPEHLLPLIKMGAKTIVSVMAYPERTFEGRITNIGSAIDPNTRTVAVRSEILNPASELLPHMLATFVINTGKPMRSPAVPQNGVVRLGDNTMVVFVTRDGLGFEPRIVKTGMTQNGLQQILDGLSEGEKVATDGALFLSNSLPVSVR